MENLVVKPKAEKALLNRHPWLFSGAVHQPPKAETGAIVEVRGQQGSTYGYGFWDGNSKIRCRIFHWGPEAENFEKPDYWQEKFQQALRLRKQLVKSKTNAFRLVHAEGDECPGVILDVYDQVVVGQFLVPGTQQCEELFAEALNNLGFTHLYRKTKGASTAAEEGRSSDGWLRGGHEGSITIQEHGLQFEVDVEAGQKTGFYLDQRENRLLVQQLSVGKNVLNAFSYTGGFSVYALAGDAQQVVSVDASQEAVKLAEENVRLNFPQAPHQVVVADCFQYLREMPEHHFDLVILDPPAFAKSQRAVSNAARGYKQINLQAFRKIRSGGLLFTFSCSGNISKELFQKIVFGAAADSGRAVRILYQLHQPPDHPVNIYHPEGEYLKGLVLQVV